MYVCMYADTSSSSSSCSDGNRIVPRIVKRVVIVPNVREREEEIDAK